MNGRISVGDTFKLSRMVSDDDVIMFAEVTGDKNPLHLDDEYAKTTMFGERIAHGMISAGIISGAIGMHFPGKGTTYLGQNLKFVNPVRIGDTITVSLEVESIVSKSRFDIAEIKTVCTNQDGVVIMDGMATVIPPIVKEIA